MKIKNKLFPFFKNSRFNNLPLGYTVDVILHPFYRDSEKITWEEVRLLVNYNDINSVANRMLKSIGAIKDTEPEISDSFDRILDDLGIEYPIEGDVPSEVIQVFLESLQNDNKSSVVVWSEVGDSYIVTPTDEDKIKLILDDLEFSHGVLSDLDQTTFVVPFWDGFYSFLISNNKNLKRNFANNYKERLYSHSLEDTIYFGEHIKENCDRE